MQQANNPLRQQWLQLTYRYVSTVVPKEFAHVRVPGDQMRRLIITKVFVCKAGGYGHLWRQNSCRSLVRDAVGVVPKVFRQEISPCKFAAFASFHETIPLAVSSAMLRFGSVTFMSTGAKAFWFWIRFNRTSNFSHCHWFRSYLHRPALTVIESEVPQIIHNAKF